LDITTWPLCERWDDVTLERAFPGALDAWAKKWNKTGPNGPVPAKDLLQFFRGGTKSGYPTFNRRGKVLTAEAPDGSEWRWSAGNSRWARV
jgi:hypothetical protein